RRRLDPAERRRRRRTRAAAGERLLDVALSAQPPVSPATTALLAGLLGPPVVLLWLGHGYRSRPATARRVFWGGIIGYILAALVAATAAILPPVQWSQHGIRTVLVHGSLLVGPPAGAGLAWLVTRRRRRSAHTTGA